MATIIKLKSGAWRVQVRRKGQYTSQTFRSNADAKRWAAEIERNIDVGRPVSSPASRDARTLADLIALHIKDMCDVGRAPLRSEARALDILSRVFGHLKVHQISRDTLTAFAKQGAKAGAGPVTVSIHLGYIKMVLLHAAAVVATGRVRQVERHPQLPAGIAMSSQRCGVVVA